MILRTARFALLFCCVAAVHANDIIKCRSPRGQIIYSDMPCEKMGAKIIGTVDATPNEVDGIRRGPVATPPSPLYSPAASSNNSGVSTQARPADVKARERRQHELGLIINGLTTTPEQKQAAHEELASVGAFGTCNLSETDRKRRDGLYADLGSLVLTRRAAAFAPLRALLSSCEKI
jgi:hypothetical protein